MRLTAIQIENIRSFKQTPKIDLSKTINLFVGPNNSGKSTILNCIFLIQRQVFESSDITIGQDSGTIELFYEGSFEPYIPNNKVFNKIKFQILKKGIARNIGKEDNSVTTNLANIPELEPLNLIYPYLSKRKTVKYANQINESNANAVVGNFVNLYSKIDRLVTPQFQPANNEYVKACNSILGFEISTLAKGDGKQAVYFVRNLEHINLTAMGEGVANIVGLITDLCVAEDRIFLIEEPENDIHPRALKALLNFIIEKSSFNQFFVSTHSNIVMKYLGSAPESKIFYVNNDSRDLTRGNLFISTIRLISNKYEDRRNVLEDLGYDFFDFDLWKAWLFLEESSAEKIINDYLIEWFVKPLKNQLRTYSSAGITNLLPRFEDFDRLFVFLYLEPTYKNRVWVLLDGGEEERTIIERMKKKYTLSGWDANNFQQLLHHDFEKYYPKIFQKKVKEVLKIEDKKIKREAKKQLLDEVLMWIQNDNERAKKAFYQSAKEIIEYLKGLNRQINKK
jgi:AAA15 family ATPase/GTPase